MHSATCFGDTNGSTTARIRNDVAVQLDEDDNCYHLYPQVRRFSCRTSAKTPIKPEYEAFIEAERGQIVKELSLVLPIVHWQAQDY